MTIKTFIDVAFRKLDGGPKVAYNREVVRKRILQSSPIQGIGENLDIEIHMLTSLADWINLLWTLKSFYYFSEEKYALCIHDDGSLTDDACATLTRLFPGCRIIRREIADKEIIPWLKEYPRSQIIRKRNIIASKEFDFVYYNQAKKSIILDSDVLFFQKPEFFLNKVNDSNYDKNLFNRDLQSALSLPIDVLKDKYGIDVLDCYNSGLGLVQGESIRREWVEEFLMDTDVLNHHWRFEQTLHALCSCRYGAELLPNDYDVYEGPLKSNPVARHYVGMIRNQMYGEGMLNLAKQGILK